MVQLKSVWSSVSHSPLIWRWLSPPPLDLVRSADIFLKYCYNYILFAADSGSDFISDTLTASFTSGTTRACVNFIVRDDNVALEGDETFTATFETPEGFLTTDPSTATVTIIDDDGQLYISGFKSTTNFIQICL